MSTVTQTAIRKSAITAFLKLKESAIKVECNQGLITLTTIEGTPNGKSHATICVGEYDGTDIDFTVSYKDVSSYVRAVSAKESVTFSVDGTLRELTLSSDTIGYMKFPAIDKDTTPDPLDIFDKLGSFKVSFPFESVKIASEITDRCDPDQNRFALGCVLIENGLAIATDGRRLVTLDTGAEWSEAVMIQSSVIDYATKHGFGIDVHEYALIAGDVVIDRPNGRFPTWQQVIQECDELTSVSGDYIRKIASTHIAQKKAAKLTDEMGVDIQLGDKTAKLNAKFLLTAVGKLKALTFGYNSKKQLESSNGDKLVVAVSITSGERPGWQEVIMPMARDC